MTRTKDISVQVDGARDVFDATFEYIADSLEVELNGVRQREGFVTELSTSTFQLFEAPKLGDSLRVQAEVAGPGETVIQTPLVSASGIDPARC